MCDDSAIRAEGKPIRKTGGTAPARCSSRSRTGPDAAGLIRRVLPRAKLTKNILYSASVLAIGQPDATTGKPVFSQADSSNNFVDGVLPPPVTPFPARDFVIKLEVLYTHDERPLVRRTGF